MKLHQAEKGGWVLFEGLHFKVGDKTPTGEIQLHDLSGDEDSPDPLELDGDTEVTEVLKPTPTQIAACYEDIHRNHEPDRKIPFAQFVTFVEAENTTAAELSDIEYMCDRVDIWMDNLGLPSSYNQIQWPDETY